MLLSKHKRKPEAWNKHVAQHFESEATSLSADTAHPFRLIPWLLELDSGKGLLNEPTLRMRWPKYWSFSFRISPSNEYSGLISFRIDWLDLLLFWVTLNNLLQHHSSKASVLRRSAFLWSSTHIHTWLLEKLFPVLWPLLSFPNLLAYWVKHFHSIIFLGFEIAQLEFHHLH